MTRLLSLVIVGMSMRLATPLLQGKSVYRQASRLFSIDSHTRARLLDEALGKMGASDLSDWGRPASKIYRAFVESTLYSDIHVVARAADRTARQMAFERDRHVAQTTEWIRNHDSEKRNRQVFDILLVLSNLRSAANVGSLFRTAEATGCREILTIGITPHDKVQLNKTALGAQLTVSTKHYATWQDALDYIRRDYPQYTVYGLETTEKSALYTSVEYSTEGVAIILGNEVTGVDADLLEAVDGILEIPMFGHKNSLNVAVCGPIVLYEVLRQWKK
jgi:23S rRNA (guanosine2251-2'-O)-methyltransferase